MICAVFINGRWGHLGMPNCKKNQIGFMQESLGYKIGKIPLRFCVFSKKAFMTGLLLFNFETTTCKNHFEYKFGQNPFSSYGDNVIFMF